MQIANCFDIGQGSWTRTSGLCIPSAALYQTELYPVIFLLYNLDTNRCILSLVYILYISVS